MTHAPTPKPAHRILFVCLGNICRSPTAEAVFRMRAGAFGLNTVADSAGLISAHAGAPPDPRTIAAARERGIAMDDLRARRVTTDDFLAFDRILAMDASNLDGLAPLRPAWDRRAAEPELLMRYAPPGAPREVPDPYYGGEDGFGLVLDLVTEAVDGLIRSLREGEAPHPIKG